MSTPASKRAITTSRPSCLALMVFLVCSSIAIANAADQANLYPGRLGIHKGKSLSASERQVEARFAKYLEEHTDEAIARYIAKYGKEINTDNSRELSREYAPEGPDTVSPNANLARTKWSAAVHEPASAFTREIYRRALQSIPGPQQRKQVIFTAGGAGAGKTTSIRQLPGLEHAVEAAEIVYDTTLSNLKSSLERVAQALTAGRMVSIIFVYRDPLDSFVGGVLPRARRTGRTLPLEAFLDTHLNAPDVLVKIAATFKGNKNVAIAVIDNSRGKGEAKAADLKFVRRVAGKYSREALKKELMAALEEAYAKGKKGEKDGISEIIYRAIKESAP